MASFRGTLSGFFIVVLMKGSVKRGGGEDIRCQRGGFGDFDQGRVGRHPVGGGVPDVPHRAEWRRTPQIPKRNLAVGSRTPGAPRREVPLWRAGELPTKIGGLRGDILFESNRIKRISPRAPQERFWGRLRRHKLPIPRLVAADCISLEGTSGAFSLLPSQLLFPAQTLRWFAPGTLSLQAPAHAFRCASFSHRKSLCGGSPVSAHRPLLRPKEGLRSFLWKPTRSEARAGRLPPCGGREVGRGCGSPRRFAPRNDSTKSLSSRRPNGPTWESVPSSFRGGRHPHRPVAGSYDRCFRRVG